MEVILRMSADVCRTLSTQLARSEACLTLLPCIMLCDVVTSHAFKQLQAACVYCWPNSPCSSRCCLLLCCLPGLALTPLLCSMQLLLLKQQLYTCSARHAWCPHVHVYQHSADSPTLSTYPGLVLPLETHTWLAYITAVVQQPMLACMLALTDVQDGTYPT